MLIIISLFVLLTSAFIGVLGILCLIDEVIKERKNKRKEKFKQEVLEVIHEIEEDKK